MWVRQADIKALYHMYLALWVPKRGNLVSWPSIGPNYTAWWQRQMCVERLAQYLTQQCSKPAISSCKSSALTTALRATEAGVNFCVFGLFAFSMLLSQTSHLYRYRWQSRRLNRQMYGRLPGTMWNAAANLTWILAWEACRVFIELCGVCIIYFKLKFGDLRVYYRFSHHSWSDRTFVMHVHSCCSRRSGNDYLMMWYNTIQYALLE